MAAYVVVEVQVHNPDAYTEYRRLVPPTLEPFGGRFLVRGGQVETLEGDWRPERFVILQFPDIARAKAWWSSPAYTAIRDLRYHNATSRMIVVEGVG